MFHVASSDAAEARHAPGRPFLICDLTQSYSASAGGGISTYLREKRDFLREHTPHHLLQIVPGERDRVTVSDRHVFAEVAAPRVHGSPNYRFILRTRAVRALLREYRPGLIESLCPWVLPWAAVRHRRDFPETTLVAGYRTDFPNAHVHRLSRRLLGESAAGLLRSASYRYAVRLYREFDWVYTLSDTTRARLAELGIAHSSTLPLGVDAALFDPARRNPGYRAALGLGGRGPLLVYAGRLDREKGADLLVRMFRNLPPGLDAAMVMIGDGKLRRELEREATGLPIAFQGFVRDRTELARALASADIYVSAMADETFGISVLEAQAAGLPVVGVAQGAMSDRVPPGLGLLGPAGDAETMAANVVRLWTGGRAAAMGGEARRLATQFQWRRTFEDLLGAVYPAATVRRIERLAHAQGERYDCGEASLAG